jgi:hypothetical protein
MFLDIIHSLGFIENRPVHSSKHNVRRLDSVSETLRFEE